MSTNNLTAFAVHFLDETGGIDHASVIEAADYWDACTMALGVGAVDFKVFEGSRWEVEALAGAAIRDEVRAMIGEEEYRKAIYS